MGKIIGHLRNQAFLFYTYKLAPWFYLVTILERVPSALQFMNIVLESK